MKELLPHDVIEYILERLDVKTLLKFTTVSKQWKYTIIQCRSFQERQMHRRKQSGKTHVVLVSLYDGSASNPYNIGALRTLVVGSTVSVKIPTTWETKFYKVFNTSCDGLIYLYDLFDPSIVVNPTTRWHRTIPPCNYQLEAFERIKNPLPTPGFGKDKINGTYNLVWLYNSAELGLENKITTTCEVFDFTTNAWRYIVPAYPYLICPTQYPVYSDGSLHWLNKGKDEVLSLDLHTETFEVIPKLPFLPGLLFVGTTMCSLDDRLCVSEKVWPEQVIWSFYSKDKRWKKLYSIDLNITFSWRSDYAMTLKPLSVLKND